MNVLVVSFSNVVVELLKMVFKEHSLKSENQKSIQDAKSDSYSIIFVDDSTPNYKTQLQELIDNFSYSSLIFIGNGDKEIESSVDFTIKKPFLPNDIEEILAKIKIEPPKSKTKVLDAQEIERIKALMDLDLEDEDENQELEKNSAIELIKDKKSLKLKRKEAKEFLYDCTNLSQKELKKLLKGAKVSIKIKYKSSENE
jgi:hypothetical protein